MKIEVGFVDADRWVDGHFEDENCEGKTIHWIFDLSRVSAVRLRHRRPSIILCVNSWEATLSMIVDQCSREAFLLKAIEGVKK